MKEPTGDDMPASRGDTADDHVRVALDTLGELIGMGQSVRELSVGSGGVSFVLGPPSVRDPSRDTGSSEGAPRGYAARATTDFLRRSRSEHGGDR